jgi:hypothetical protein
MLRVLALKPALTAFDGVLSASVFELGLFERMNRICLDSPYFAALNRLQYRYDGRLLPYSVPPINAIRARHNAEAPLIRAASTPYRHKKTPVISP